MNVCEKFERIKKNFFAFVIFLIFTLSLPTIGKEISFYECKKLYMANETYSAVPTNRMNLMSVNSVRCHADSYLTHSLIAKCLADSCAQITCLRVCLWALQINQLITLFINYKLTVHSPRSISFITGTLLANEMPTLTIILIIIVDNLKFIFAATLHTDRHFLYDFLFAQPEEMFKFIVLTEKWLLHTRLVFIRWLHSDDFIHTGGWLLISQKNTKIHLQKNLSPLVRLLAHITNIHALFSHMNFCLLFFSYLPK
jgi:hypothetical protein